MLLLHPCLVSVLYCYKSYDFTSCASFIIIYMRRSKKKINLFQILNGYNSITVKAGETIIVALPEGGEY